MDENKAGLTPEKQLLNLIEEPHLEPVKKAGMKARKVTSLSAGALHGRLVFLKDNLFSFTKLWSGPLDLKKINRVLIVLSIVIGIYFAVSSGLLNMRLKSLGIFSVKTESAAKLSFLKDVSQLKALTYYMEKVHSRDIFKLGREQTAEVSMKESAVIDPQDTSLSKFRLVGISWSDNPDVMLENTEESKTFFLKRGQMIDGVKIQAVFRDKIVLRYKDQEVELR